MRYFWNRYEIFLHKLPVTGVVVNADRYTLQGDCKSSPKFITLDYKL
jgi:hypothetical protein